MKVQRRRLTKLAKDEMRASNDIEIIMDDETYLDENGNNFGGNKTYMVFQDNLVPNEVKFYSKKKYPMKLLAWIAISSKGHSGIYFRRGSMAINSETYQNNCLKKHLLPFIKNNHSDGQYLFWPDLASAHYAKSTIQFLNEHNIKVLDKKKNPPNLPQLRPIETFFAHWKSRIYSNGWKPQNIDQLEEKAKKTLRTFGKEYYQNLMANVARKVRLAYHKGPLSVVN